MTTDPAPSGGADADSTRRDITMLVTDRLGARRGHV